MQRLIRRLQEHLKTLGPTSALILDHKEIDTVLGALMQLQEPSTKELEARASRLAEQIATRTMLDRLTQEEIKGWIIQALRTTQAE